MSILLLAILIGLLSIIIYQDFKSREISWFLIPLLFVAGIANALYHIELFEFTSYVGINLSIIILNLLGVTLFISLKEKKLKNIIDSYLGLGDVLFFLVLTTIFSPFNFILFFIGSILITSIVYVGVILFKQQKQTLIPLAGAMSLLLVIALVVQYIHPSFNFYQDLFIFE